jgi:hypothetical protein
MFRSRRERKLSREFLKDDSAVLLRRERRSKKSPRWAPLESQSRRQSAARLAWDASLSPDDVEDILAAYANVTLRR